jgi:hypothetical protein
MRNLENSLSFSSEAFLESAFKIFVVLVKVIIDCVGLCGLIKFLRVQAGRFLEGIEAQKFAISSKLQEQFSKLLENYAQSLVRQHMRIDMGSQLKLVSQTTEASRKHTSNRHQAPPPCSCPGSSARLLA